MIQSVPTTESTGTSLTFQNMIESSTKICSKCKIEKYLFEFLYQSKVKFYSKYQDCRRETGMVNRKPCTEERKILNKTFILERKDWLESLNLLEFEHLIQDEQYPN